MDQSAEDEQDDPEEVSRVLFGYLARFCPQLQEVSLRCYKLTLSLRGGFTLLTRIKTLKKIAITHFSTKFEERDILPWAIKQSSPPSPSNASGPMTRGLGPFIKGVAVAGYDRSTWIMDKAVGVAWRWFYQQEMRLLRREIKSEFRRTLTDNGEKDGETEETDRNGNGFSNTKGAHWMCTVSKTCYRDLGYLRDVVNVLSDLLEQQPKSSPSLCNPTSLVFGGDNYDTWPDLVRLRFIHVNEKFQRRFIGPLLKKHRPELDFEWENWNHDDRT